ncbi:MAG: adenosylmethionine decarboxylase [Candidatus Sericytochromatia bacterium]|nr:adenosylmethionine decarboxylase [Candidatus Sericytochromatia bacterium]
MPAPEPPASSLLIPASPAGGKARYLGRQVLLELYGCPPERLTERAGIEAAMLAAARACAATVVESVFHAFNPHGVSGVVIIAESHLTIHTWPEHGYAAVDVFTCGHTIDPAEAVDSLATALAAAHVSVTEVNRGALRHLRA